MELTKYLNLYREKTLSVLIIAAALFIAFNIYKSQNNRLNELMRVKEEETRKNEIIAKIQDTNKLFNVYREVIKVKDVDSCINTITGFAQECGVTISSIKPAKETDLQAYVSYPFELTVSADSYHNIAKFISKIETDNGLYFVDKLSIKIADPTAKGPNRLSAEIILSTIGLKE